MAAVAVWDVRPSGTALRPAPVAAVATPAVGADAGVAAVCALAGVAPAVRRAGGAGAVGGGQQRVHGAVRRAGGVSGAGDRPDDGQSRVGISWQAVGSIVERMVSRRLDPERLAGLRRIGVD